MHTMEYYLDMSKNKTMPFAVPWMVLEVMISSEINQTEKNKYYMMSLIC